MSLVSRIVNAVRSSRLDRDLADELQFHIDARIEELVRRGTPLRQAGQEARRHFGNTLALRESSRDARLLPWLESLAQDVRFGTRVLLKNRAATFAALATLSLALGASIAAFTLIDGLMLKPLPVWQPQRLVYFSYSQGGPADHLGAVNPPADIERFSYPIYRRFRDSSAGQADLFTASSQFERSVAFADSGGRTEKARGQWVSGNFFSNLQLKPALGRLIAPADDQRPGASPVAVISYRYWMRRFAGNSAVLGRWFTMNEVQYQIVGVAEKSFSGIEPGISSDIWVPNMMWDARAFSNAGWGWMALLARLKPGVGREQIRQSMQAVFTNFRRERVRLAVRGDAPQDAIDRYVNAPLHIHDAAHGPSGMRSSFTRPLLILALVAGLVLLIACSNLANLFTARALAREREMAMRISIGAGRGRLLQQVLIEGGLLTAVACLAGLAFARLAAPAIVGMLSRSGSPAYLDLGGDSRILAFTAVAGIAAMLLFGLIPALRASRVPPGEALKSGPGRHSGRAAVLRPMVTAQVAFSFMVLFLGGLLITTFEKLSHVDLGFSKDGVALFTVDARQLPRAGQVNAALQWLDRVRAIPQVRSASISEWALFSGSTWTNDVRVPGQPVDLTESVYLPISTGFLQTMGMRLLDGRDLDFHDMAPGSPSVLVNEAFARHFFPGQNPIGKRYFRRDRDRETPQEIVGLVRNAHYDDVWEKAPLTVYVPLRSLDSGTLEIRTSSDSLLRALDRLQPGVRLNDEVLQSTLVADRLVEERLLAILSGFFALVAMVLVAVGLYGVLSYAVVRRTREIGIRMALGARQGSVVRLIVSEIALVTGLGLALGLTGGLLLARQVEKLLYEVKPSDLWSLALPVAVLLLAATSAALAPGMRAARVDPAVALRSE